MRQIDLASHLWTDDRGWSLEAMVAAGLPASALGNLHIVSMRPGAIRGQHLHTVCTEWLLVTHGPVELAWQAPNDPEFRRLTLDGLDVLGAPNTLPALFEIPRHTAHAVRNPGSRDIFLLSFSDSQARDTVKVPDLFAKDLLAKKLKADK